MTRYWLLTPFDVRDSSWPAVWDHDLKNKVISIGWHELGDLSNATERQIRAHVGKIFPKYPPGSVTWLTNIFSAFYHSIAPGDLVLVRKGRKEIVGVGSVTGPAYYEGKFASTTGIPRFDHPNVLPVEWQKDFQPRVFDEMMFGIQTMYEVSREQHDDWLRLDTAVAPSVPAISGATLEQAQEFVLERYLEDFIATNFSAIFGKSLKLFFDPVEKVFGQQYSTEVGRIDLLAQSSDESEFVVIELKKGLTSDQVVGQTLRYMGWVSSNLCKKGQKVRGIIISKEADPRLEYALKVTPTIQHKRYDISFSLK